MFDSLKSLCKDVSYLVSCWNVLKFNTSFIDAFSDKVLADVDMFHVHVKCRIDCKCQSTLVVT